MACRHLLVELQKPLRLKIRKHLLDSALCNLIQAYKARYHNETEALKSWESKQARLQRVPARLIPVGIESTQGWISFFGQSEDEVL